MPKLSLHILAATLVLTACAPDIAGLEAKCRGADAQSCVELGSRYAAGYGVEADPARALEWMERAARLGHKVGQLNLAEAYELGSLEDPDGAEAYFWYVLAAQQGLEKAVAGRERVGPGLDEVTRKEVEARAAAWTPAG